MVQSLENVSRSSDTQGNPLLEGQRRCTQIRCKFYILGGCLACANCGTKSYILNNGCGMCNACEREQDALRFEIDIKDTKDNNGGN